MLLMIGGTVYAFYMLWLFTLLALLPASTGEGQGFVLVGLTSAIAGGVGFLLLVGIVLKRIAKADVSVVTRRRSLLKAILVLLPGLILSGVTPIMITREPPLTVAVTSPSRAEDLVAPLAVTFSVEQAVEILRSGGQKPIQFQWDYEGDGQPNEETVLPVATAVYDRQGSYTVVVLVHLERGGVRRITRRLVIPKAVFSVSPVRPTVEKPVRFSVGHLLTDPKQLKEVQWDFNGDGDTEETVKSPDIVHTFYSVGRVKVVATMRLQNQAQTIYERIVEVFEPAPLAFPATLLAEPRNLVGPAPFGTIFRVDTEEPLKEALWLFGDGKEERGGDVKRVGHVYEKPGIYSLSVRLRSTDGVLAELTTIVRVTENLNLPDLRFDGEPQVKSNKVVGEAPLIVSLTPKTVVPLIEFFWEAPDATNVHSTGATLQAVYRTAGTYTVTLIAQDPEGRTLRQPITIEAKEPSPVPVIRMKPESGVAPLRVRFDASESYVPPGEVIAGFQWSFGDEGAGKDYEPGAAQAEHLYKLPGEYIVTVRIVTKSGREFIGQQTLIVRRPTLDACISASRLRGLKVGDGVEFDSSCSTGIPSTVLWDVRLDALGGTVLAQSAGEKYIYVFEQPGTYTITLTIRDEWGNQSREILTLTVVP